MSASNEARLLSKGSVCPRGTSSIYAHGIGHLLAESRLPVPGLICSSIQQTGSNFLFLEKRHAGWYCEQPFVFVFFPFVLNECTSDSPLEESASG